MRSRWGRVGSVVMSVTFAAVCPQTAEAGLIEHLDLAELLVATVTPAANAYGDPTEITWEGSNGLDHSTNRSKCATLITELFEKAYDPDYVAWLGCTSPHAATYHDAIEVEERLHPPRAPSSWCSRATSLPSSTPTLAAPARPAGPSRPAAPAGMSPSSPTTRKPALRARRWCPVRCSTASTSSTRAPATTASRDTRYQADAAGAHDQGVRQGTMRLYVNSKDTSIVGHSLEHLARLGVLQQRRARCGHRSLRGLGAVPALKWARRTAQPLHAQPAADASRPGAATQACMRTPARVRGPPRAGRRDSRFVSLSTAVICTW